ncbi:MAG TPA: OmpA family protein [Anaeromyxobacteraceae bacterium]|nr:OmpA family protein [Anaeromyxobacteraceae bacterium]
MRRLALATLAVLAAACGVSKDEFAASQRDAASARAQLQAESERAAALEAKLKDREQQVAGLEKGLEAEKAHSAEQAERIKGLEASAAKLEEEKVVLVAKSAQYEQLTASLQGQIANGQVEISELKGKMMVKLKDRVLFASGSTALGKEGRAALDAVAAAFKDLKGKTVVVGGYTDNVPTGANSGFSDNWDLSTARAVTVVRYLQSRGVPPALLGAAGFSEYRPLASNETSQGRSQNRRIEIALTADDPGADVTAANAAPAASP